MEGGKLENPEKISRTSGETNYTTTLLRVELSLVGLSRALRFFHPVLRFLETFFICIEKLKNVSSNFTWIA